jgi:hypothetical protein
MASARGKKREAPFGIRLTPAERAKLERAARAMSQARNEPCSMADVLHSLIARMREPAAVPEEPLRKCG